MQWTDPCSVFGGQDEVQVASVTHGCESQVSPELVSLMWHPVYWGQPKALHSL